MTQLIYNVSLIVGIVLIGAGVAMVSVPGALITVGTLILAMTVVGAYMTRKG